MLVLAVIAPFTLLPLLMMMSTVERRLDRDALPVTEPVAAPLPH